MIALMIALVAMTSSAMAASRATLTTLPHGTFSLRAARSTALRYEAHLALGGQLGTCAWIDRHDAGCPVSYELVVVNGEPAEHLVGTDIVTRSGPCSVTGRTWHKPDGLEVVKGQHAARNCFTGPLLVLAGGGLSLAP